MLRAGLYEQGRRMSVLASELRRELDELRGGRPDILRQPGDGLRRSGADGAGRRVADAGAAGQHRGELTKASRREGRVGRPASRSESHLLKCLVARRPAPPIWCRRIEPAVPAPRLPLQPTRRCPEDVARYIEHMLVSIDRCVSGLPPSAPLRGARTSSRPRLPSRASSRSPSSSS